MKNSILLSILTVFIISCKEKKSTTQYVVNKETSGCVCRVENPESRPQHGQRHLGPFDTREEAIRAMCEDIDPEMENQNKCWTTVPSNACANSNSTNLNSKKIQLKYNHYELVRNLQQPKSMDCWATALTMLYSWKNKDNTIKIEDVLAQYDPLFVELFKNNTGISEKLEEDLYQKAKMNVIKGLSPTIEGWYEILKNNGPLSITVAIYNPNTNKRYIHALVVNGIKGDGSPSNTIISYIDPGDGNEHKLNFFDFTKLYDGAADWPLQIIHW